MRLPPMLPTRLRETTLGDVLGDLHRRRVSGVLEIEAGGRISRVLLVDGAPATVMGPDDAPIGSSVGAPKARVEEALTRQASGDARLLGEILEELGTPRRDVAEALHRQALARLDALFALRDATLRFRAVLFAGERLHRWHRAGPRAPRLTPREFLLGRPRARQRAHEARTASTDRQEALSILGLSQEVDLATLRAAFRRAVSAEHPDRAVDDADRAVRTARVARLSAAFHRLAV
jgi:hypothetical protein